MRPIDRPQWRLPRGVTRGLWDYVHSDAIADDYDDYFRTNSLFELDQQVLLGSITPRLLPGAWIADLGCGTGRALLPLVKRGYRGLAVDLSERMLSIVRAKAEKESLPVECVKANLVELDAIRDDCVDAAICLFSTLGMIRGADNRRHALREFHRILKERAVFAIHVHNYWYNLYDPGGPWWVVLGYLRSLVDARHDPGDKFFSYRGVPNMFLHVFTYGEIRRELRRAGFRVLRIIPLNQRRRRALRFPWLLGRFRANGWIIVAEA